MGRPKRLQAAGVLALVLAAAACGGGSDDEAGDDAGGRGGLTTPTFADEEDTAGSESTTSTTARGSAGATTTTSGAASSTPDGGSAPSTSAGGAADSTIEQVSFDDPVGDATRQASLATPPPWTDLAGGSLERDGNAYRLTIRLGGPAPKTAPGSETMNIATFFDTDGDAGVERELWVNLGRNGWGPVWYDDEGNAAPGERSNVNVVVEGDTVRLLFPDVMLRKAPRLRFSIASEYGPITTIGTSQARRDDAPDGNRAVSFP